MQKGGGDHWRRPSWLWTGTPSCGRRGILSKPARVTGPRRSHREGRHKPRSPCSASAREGALRPCPTLRSPAAPPRAPAVPQIPRGRRAGPRAAAPGFSLSDSPERRAPGEHRDTGGREGRDRRGSAGSWPRLAPPPQPPEPRAPFRGAGAAEPAEHRQGDPAGRVGAQHAPGGSRGGPRPSRRLPRHRRRAPAAGVWSRAWAGTALGGGVGPSPPQGQGSPPRPAEKGRTKKLDLPPSAGTEVSRRNKNKVPSQARPLCGPCGGGAHAAGAGQGAGKSPPAGGPHFLKGVVERSFPPAAPTPRQFLRSKQVTRSSRRPAWKRRLGSVCKAPRIRTSH